MDMPIIQAWPREERGTRACGRLRRRGLIPAVLYGRGEPNVLLTVRESDVETLLAEHSLILQVEWDGNTNPVQIREVRYDALGDSILHTDLGRISLTETIQVSVPVRTHGEHASEKEGGVLDMALHEIEIECLPGNVPESIVVEISGLTIGDAVRIGGVTFPEGVSPVPGPETVVVSILSPAEIPAEEEAAEEELVTGEPELIGREEAEAKEGEEAEAPAPEEPKAKEE